MSALRGNVATVGRHAPEEGDRLVGIGTSIFLLALGAILTFAVNADVGGLDIAVVGVILMIAGALGLLVTLLFLNRSAPFYGRFGRGATTTTTVRDEREVL